AVGALRGARHGDGDELAILPRDGAILALGDAVEAQPGFEVGWRQRAHVAQQLDVTRVVVMVRHPICPPCAADPCCSPRRYSRSAPNRAGGSTRAARSTAWCTTSDRRSSRR